MKMIQKILCSFAALLFMFSFSAPALAAGLSIPENTTEQYDCTVGMSEKQCLKNNPITEWIVFFINLFAVAIIIGASAMLIFAGIEYITSADNPDRVKSAKQKIINVIMGIVAFFFLYAFLQWLVPGGVL